MSAPKLPQGASAYAHLLFPGILNVNLSYAQGRISEKNPTLHAEASVLWSPCFSLQSMNCNHTKYFGSRIVEANIANWISAY